MLVCPRNSNRIAESRKSCADLVVDATVARRAPRWLKIWVEPPEEIVIDAHLAYAAGCIAFPRTSTAIGMRIRAVRATGRKRGGILFKVEDNRWLLTLIGGPPTIHWRRTGFLSLRSLRVQHLRCDSYAEPLRRSRPSRDQNRLRRYERAKEMPENFFVLGDAAVLSILSTVRDDDRCAWRMTRQVFA